MLISILTLDTFKTGIELTVGGAEKKTIMKTTTTSNKKTNVIMAKNTLCLFLGDINTTAMVNKNALLFAN